MRVSSERIMSTPFIKIRMENQNLYLPLFQIESVIVRDKQGEWEVVIFLPSGMTFVFGSDLALDLIYFLRLSPPVGTNSN